MRILTLALLATLLTTSVFAQPWLKNLPAGKSRSELTLFDYQQAFETYWAPFNVDKGSYFENGVKKKAPGWKQFKRWEYEMQSQVHPVTGAFHSKSAIEIRNEFERANPRTPQTVTADWSPLGPTSSFSGYSGIGRLNCVAFHPTDINTFWVGAAAGGLWMTTDNGASWTCQTDNNGVLAVSDIVIPADYETSNTIYIATGDRDAWDNRSIGVLKSTDRGQTWNATGLSFTIYEGQMVNRLMMDPTNNQFLIAATTRGVFKTLDGGTTWDTKLTDVEFIDMEFKITDANTIYGSTKYGQIFLSTDGTTFNAVYADGNATRIELAVSPNQPEWVYALASNGNSGLYGIFKSTDSGASYVETFSGTTKNLLTWESDGSGGGGQGWYDLSLATSPSNADVLLVGGVNTWRSTDGGFSWSIVNHWYGDQVQAVHADKHKLAFRDNGDLFECNDGGVYLSLDNGTSWADKTNGIQISQMYRLGVAQTGPEDVITGLQDNGTKLISGETWFDVIGGDGMECLIDYTNADIQYGSLYFGDINRTDNHWLSSKNVTPPDNGAWVTPYIIDPNDPATLYGGYNEMWKSTDRGDSWEQISFIDPPGQIQSIGIAPSDSRIICFADYSQIWRTTNGGTDWTNINNNLPTNNANIEYITVKHDDPNTIWVVLGGYTNPGVYQSTDGGATWASISAGLPPIPAHAVVENTQHTDVVHLYLGTDLGVYFKRGDEDWTPYNNGLPNVRIGEIEIYYAGNPGESKLRAATYGRGLWETPIEYTPSPMVYVSSTAIQNNKSNVAPGQANQDILKVEITTTGNLSPFSVTSFTFNTNGSTDPSTDINNARLFYTGSSNTFSAANPFGNVVASPEGEFTITGTQELNDGRNNFWLAYDVDSSATLGHILDAECTSLTVDTPKELVVTAPEGSRTIGYEYCEGGAAQMTYEYISNFRMGAVNQHSDKGVAGYEDYTSETIDMVIGEEMAFELENGVPYASDEVLIWVDWNIDGDFDDADEFVFASGPSGAMFFNGSFAPPASAKTDVTRMRVRLHDRDNGPNDKPCGYATWGEVEDYSVRVAASGPCNALSYLAYKAESIAGDYVDLGSDGTIIPTVDFDNANSDPQEIGFDFEYNCNTFSQFVLNTNGFIKLGDTSPSAADLYFDDPRATGGGIFDNNDPADVNILSPLNLDLAGGAGGPEYRVHTTGDAPNRVCTIQYKNVREANTDPIPQYDNMQFQIKLYETSNVIEFVYGDWVPSGLGNDFRTVACGLKGSSRADNQLLVVSKTSEQTWEDVQFTNANYFSTTAIYYSTPPESPKPDAGRTLRFVPRYNHDLAIEAIYTLGEASRYYSSPQAIGVNIKNIGFNAIQNIPVTITVSGANSFSATRELINLGRDENQTVPFHSFSPSVSGATTIQVALQDDEDLSNNNITWQQQVTDYECNYASAAPPDRGWGAAPDEERIYAATYQVTGTAAVSAVKVYIANDPKSVGQTVYGVVLNPDGSVAAQSEVLVIQEVNLGTWHTFPMISAPVVTNERYFAGFATTSSPTGYAALGAQREDPLRHGTFYESAIDGSNLTPFDQPYRFMIGVILAPTAPDAGIAGSDLVLCSGWYGELLLQEYSGHIQWQESPDGLTNWVNVTSGIGANSDIYMTPPLMTTTYYRAEVTQPTFAPVYSNNVWVLVMPSPGAAGPIIGDSTVCQGEEIVIYAVDEIENASLYFWTLPEGASGASDSNKIYVTYSMNANSGIISVAGVTMGCTGIASSFPVTVNALPQTPVINAVENFLQSDATTGNQWYNQNGPIPGATSQDYLATEDGTYYVIVTTDGCASAPSEPVEVIISSIKIAGDEYSLALYPNPVREQLIIEIEGNTTLIPFEIHNAFGSVMIKGEVSERASVQTDKLTPGIYFLQLKGDGMIETRKFIKE